MTHPHLHLVPAEPCDTNLYEVDVSIRFRVRGRDIEEVNKSIKVKVEGPVVGEVATGFPWITEVEEGKEIASTNT